MKQLTLCRAAAAALCLLLLAGCGAASSGPASSAGGASAAATAPADSGAACTFTDDLGREVTLEAAPRRVAALTGSYADIWCTAGGRDTLVASASDAWTDLDRKSTRLNSSHVSISYAVFCLSQKRHTTVHFIAL